MRKVGKIGLLILSLLVVLGSCEKDKQLDRRIMVLNLVDTLIARTPFPTPYSLDLPPGFPDMDIPEDNPLTEEGIFLGRMLFYDPILSKDSTQSCGSCHNQAHAFTDNGLRYSTGIDGIEGNRNSMAIINLGYMENLFWDGRSKGLEEQALEPVPNPIEMHLEWTEAVDRLNNHNSYPDLFFNAFQTTSIDKELVVKAIAQFERTIISGNSKFDKVSRGEAEFTDEEFRGYDFFNLEGLTGGGDCFHCHGTGTDHRQFTDFNFHNNALPGQDVDVGLEAVTGDPKDRGFFRTPTLRNIEHTAPYMHDGRFATLEEVVDHYSEGLHYTENHDELMKKIGEGGLHMSAQEKSDLVAFLKTLSDPDFLNNPAYSNPFK